MVFLNVECGKNDGLYFRMLRSLALVLNGNGEASNCVLVKRARRI